MADKFFKDADGAGRTLGDKLMRRAQDTDDFRTVIYDTPEGQVMLKTKGGNPELSIKRREVAAEAPVTECIASPLIEIAFKHGTPAEPVDPERNPFTLTSGYRTWHGENDPGVAGSPATVPEIQYSSDGLLYMQVRKPKKMRFLDKQNRTVDLVLARKPTKDSDADNAEYDGANTFSVVAKALATAAGAVSRFIFAEGRYRYREWYAPRSVNIDWCLPVNTSAVRFLMRRLKKLTLLVWDSTKPAGQEKTVDWFFAEPGIQDMPGSQPDTACANQNGREVSFANRQFFTEKGHMKEARFRVGYQNQNDGTADFRLEFKKPGSFLSQIDPEAVVPRTGNHPGVDGSPDAAEVVAFGNPYHGLMWVDGPGYSNRVLYKDSTKTSQWPWTPAEPYWGLNPYGVSNHEHQYYNVFGIENPLDVNHVVKAPDSDEMYLKDAFLFHGAWYVREAQAIGWGQLNFSHRDGYVYYPAQYEFLYRDDAGVVWVMQFSMWLNSIHGLRVQLHLLRRYGDISTSMTQSGPSLRLIHDEWFKIPNVQFDHTGVYATPNVAVADNAKGACVFLRNISHGTGNAIMHAVYFSVSGVGAVTAGAGVNVGDGITSIAVSESVGIGYKITERMAGTRGTVVFTQTGYVADQSISCNNNSGQPVNYQNLFTSVTHSVVPTPQPNQVQVTTATYLLDIYSVNGVWHKLYAYEERGVYSSTYEVLQSGSMTRTAGGYVCWPDGYGGYTPKATTGASGTCTVSYRMTTTHRAVIKLSSTEAGEVHSVIRDYTEVATTNDVWIDDGNWVRGGYDGSSSTYTESANIPELTQKNALPILMPVYSTPLFSTSASNYPYRFSPVAFTINFESKIQAVNAPDYISDGWATKIVYRSSKVSATHGELKRIADPTSQSPNVYLAGYSASVGWAYNYRTGELIKTPFGAYAYFV